MFASYKRFEISTGWQKSRLKMCNTWHRPACALKIGHLVSIYLLTPMPDHHSLPGPEDITRVTLANSLTVLVRSNFNSPSVVIQDMPAGVIGPTDKLTG
jgi:hypothetical protein